uniref:DCD domain-containing protein n=1 Tax=Leersia perrieri TaxID=77586 RepID=A0A0D9XSJ4_9ORYZ
MAGQPSPPRKRPRDPPADDGGGGGMSSPPPAGYIFMCSGATKPECYARRVMGVPRGRLAAVSRIRRGAALFLYDFGSKHLHGPYRADSDGGLDLVPAAFQGRFPAQVEKLRTLFHPIIVQPEPGLAHNFDDKHPAPPADLPPPISHPTQLADYCSMSPTAPSLACNRPDPLVEDDENGCPSGSSKSSPAGYIFMCSGVTKVECYRHRVMGLPLGSLEAVSRIRRGTTLFLYDFDAKHLYGPYCADSNGGLTLVPDAFHGRYPAQVKFTVEGDFMPIPESSLRIAIKENYSNGRFNPELTLTQVKKLRTLFRPIIVMTESSLYHNDDRHPAHPAVYLPPASHPTEPAAYVHHQTSYIPPTALPVPPESYAHPYAQMPPPNEFTTPYYMSTSEYPYKAEHTTYSSLASNYQYAQAPQSHYPYSHQSVSSHVSAPGYYTAPYYATHQIGTHPVDQGSYRLESGRTTYGSEHEVARISGATAAPDAAATNSELACNSGAATTNLQLVRNYGYVPSSMIGAAAHSSEGSQFQQATSYITHAPGTYTYGGSSTIYY